MVSKKNLYLLPKKTTTTNKTFKRGDVKKKIYRNILKSVKRYSKKVICA